MRAKKSLTALLISVVLVVLAIVLCGCKSLMIIKGNKPVLSPNEPIITKIFTADPSAHVFDGKLYIYPSHDPNKLIDPSASSDKGGQYQMVDYHVLSIDDFSGFCTDHGVALALEDIPWASQQLWAPDAAYKNGIYYFYFPAKDKDGIFRIGSATSENPAGPFTAEENYIDGSFSMDPCVFMDDDTAYMIFGGLDGGQLECWQTGEYIEGASSPANSEPALGPMITKMSEDMLEFADQPKEILIVDENGETITAGDENRRFFEAAWMHKYQGKYYLSYSTGTTHFLVYAVSDSITGPYVYQGQILTPVKGWTTHHSIVEYQGEWYLFYHDASLSDGIDYRRCVKYTRLSYNVDGTIVTIDPYQPSYR